ncbi:putative 3-oxoacyl-(acyl carrier protein) reductase [Calothrix sp. NIES-4071]|nr:putative 3-oxoacyl-(acyl carrier protein) reductase [Calothrix sp. NIES-4071]BAZ57791.1 putative 3-oxoacyl-(acyl carrier protein) reductase [Calothrix sp. NIES-4105]
MDLQLAGKRALITGSNSGIGAEIAKTLAKEGVKIIITGRNQERAFQVAEAIMQEGGEAIAVSGDLSTVEGVRQIAEGADVAFQGIDILINNAGGTEDLKAWMDTSPQEWEKTYQANVIAPVRLIQLLVPQMKKQGWGRIIQIASVAATRPLAVGADYAAAKAALVNLKEKN